MLKRPRRNNFNRQCSLPAATRYRRTLFTELSVLSVPSAFDSQSYPPIPWRVPLVTEIETVQNTESFPSASQIYEDENNLEASSSCYRIWLRCWREWKMKSIFWSYCFLVHIWRVYEFFTYPRLSFKVRKQNEVNARMSFVLTTNKTTGPRGVLELYDFFFKWLSLQR